MERVVMGMGRINTFGPIDWNTYYKQPPADSSPCRSCPHDNSCPRSVDPDRKNRCTDWIKWFSPRWPGKKKAAHSGANTEGG